MQKKILGTLFIFLFMGLGLLLYKLLNQNIEVQMDIAKNQSPLPQEVKIESTDRVWVKELAQKDAREFIFPVNELFMQIDLHGITGEKVKSYRLVIDRIDRYSLFCVVQTLTSFNLSYMVVKEDKAPFIYVQEKDNLQAIIITEMGKWQGRRSLQSCCS